MGLNVTADQKKFFEKALRTYYDAAAEILQSEHVSPRVMDSEHAKNLNAKGELSDENTASYEKLRKSFDQLLRCVSSYLSTEELNSALVELEENEHVASAERGGSERHSDSERQTKQSESGSFDANGKSSANRREENGRDYQVAADSESYSDSVSIYRDGHEDEDFLFKEKSDDRPENEVDNDDDDMPVGSDEEESVRVRQKVVQVDPKEQEDFDQVLKALLQGSLESRKLELRARPTLNMMIPMNVSEGSKGPRATEAESGEENATEESDNAGDGSKVCVKVLVKKGHKQQTKQMLIPGDCSLVQSTKQQEAAGLEEKQNISLKILEYNEREEEELNE